MSGGFQPSGQVVTASAITNRAGLSTDRPAAAVALTGVTWTYTDVGSATYTGRVDRCDGTSWVMIVPPTGTYAALAGSNSYTGTQTFLSGFIISRTAAPNNAPFVRILANQGNWEWGVDTSNHGGGKDFYLAQVSLDGVNVNDSMFINWRYPRAATFGFGVTPPNNTHRTEIGGDDGDDTLGNLRLRLGPTQTGPLFTVKDSGGNLKTELDSLIRWVGLVARCTDRTTTAGQVAFGVTDEAGGSQYSFGYAGSGSSVLRLKYATAAVTVLDVQTSGVVTFYKSIAANAGVTYADATNMVLGTTTGTKFGTATTQKLAFYNATPVVQPSGTPAAATDLATVISLANSLRTSLLALGLAA